MNRKTKWTIIILAIVLLTAGSFYYVFRPSPDSVKKVKPELSISAVDLVNDFELNEQDANLLNLDKVILVEGKVLDVSKNPEAKAIVVSLEGSSMGNVSCSFSDQEIAENDINIGATVKIKGKCAGYILDVVLTKCCLVK